MNFLFEPLNLVTFFPLVGILVILFINREQKITIRWIALITSLISCETLQIQYTRNVSPWKKGTSA